MRRKRTSQGYPAFPRTLGEFQRRFATEKACVAYLIQVRWPQGFECPRCHHPKAWRVSLRSYRCAGCRKEIHLTAGTVLHGSHLPFRYWFWSAYLMSTLTPGISALQLQKQLGIGSYETALYLCRRLRKAMVNPMREPLQGVVEVDCAYIGGEAIGRGGRWIDDKVPIIIAVENRGDHTGRVRIQEIDGISKWTAHRFIVKNIAPGSQLNTDGGVEFGEIEEKGYVHNGQVQETPAMAGVILPWVHRVIGNLKTWLRGTHHGVDKEHLQSYLDEYVFRYNRRRHREAGFLSLLILSTRSSPMFLGRKSKKLVASTG
jgi:hypothetical protein